MEDIFKTLGNILRPEQQTQVNNLKIDLSVINQKINKISPKDSYLDAVSRSFPYGVGFGGSGKGSLNARKERHLDKLIDASIELTKLYKERDNVEQKIKDIESGEVERRAERVKTRNEKLAEYWNGLKVGDELNIGNTNGNPIILKKSQKSVLTTSGTKWTVQEVIGKEAAKLI
jgi:hypothetical protein